MKVFFIDVEQGDSTLVMLSDGTTILVDCNFTKEHFPKIKKYISDNGLDQDIIDVLIITHPHEDHIRGIAELYDNFTINALYESGHRLFVSDKEKSKHYLDMIDVISKIKNSKKKYKIMKAYENLTIGTADIKVFSPSKAFLEDEKPSERDIHDQCLVFRIEENGFSVLFTGDSSMYSWKEYIVPFYSDVNGKKNLLKSTVLSASHHGSNTFFYPTSKAEDDPYTLGIEKVSPVVSIISAGVANRHGHPDRKALELYKKYSYSGKNHVYQTKDSASIIITSDEKGDFKLLTEDFIKRCDYEGMDEASAVINANPSPDGSGYYKKGVAITFQVIVSKYPYGHPASEIRWCVQNNSVKPDMNHDFYEGQKALNFFYKNETAYFGEHYLLCEVKDKTGTNICTQYLKVKVR